MSIGDSSTDTKSTANQTQTTNPYGPTTDALTSFIKSLTGQTNTNATPSSTATDALGQLITQAQGGNPFSAGVSSATSGQIGATTQPEQNTANSGLQAYQQIMNPVAKLADNTDVMSNPQVAALVSQTNQDATNAVKQAFAGAGRSGSGLAQEAIAKGIASGEAPILLNQYNTDASRGDTAAGNLLNASNTNATTNAGLKGDQAAIQSQGIANEPAALAAQQWGPEQVAQLSTTLQNLPLDQLSQIANLLFPASQLGSTTTGTKTGTSKSNSSSFGFSL